MPNLQNLLKRRPAVEELDPEVQTRLRARLAALHEPEEWDSEHDIEESAGTGAWVTAAAAQPGNGVPATILVPAPASPEPEAVEEAESPVNSLGDDFWDAAPALEDVIETTPEAPPTPLMRVLPTPEVEVSVPTGTDIDRAPRGREPWPPEARARAAPWRECRRAGGACGRVVGARPRVAPPPAPEPASPEPTVPKRAAKARVQQPAPVKAPVVAARKPRPSRAIVACPYCAEPLKVPPVASGKCPRCRLRIVVKRVGDRSIYLTEAALPVFMAQRRRAVHAGRWTLERDRWLELAKASGAAPASLARLTRLPVSEDVIASARNLYMSTVERAARAARRERRWEDAGRLRYDQALALYRIARSPKPVPAAVLAVHRDGLASSLRGIAEVARGAEMRARACCEPCRADDTRMVRISDELREPSLPHEACERGLCRCRWYLAAHDRAIVTELLKRQTRPQRRQRSVSAS